LNDASLATFLFEVDTITIGSFMEVSGLEVTVETEDVVEGGENGFVHKLPGRMTWPTITLKRGVTRQDELLRWLNASSGETFAANSNTLTRKSAAITLLDRTGARIMAWNFVDAFPVKWSGPSFASEAAEAPSETLEIAHHGFKANVL
jgi:phage tail-like protein